MIDQLLVVCRESNFPPKKSTIRPSYFFTLQSWKQLSRFQRSLLYMAVGVALVVAVFYYFNLEGGLVRERKARL